MVEFKKKILENGLTVLFEKRDVPVTTVMLAVRYGSGHDPIEEKGMAHFIEHLCFKGTRKRNVKQIAEEVEKVGGELNAFTSEEITAYHVKLPSRHLKVAMDVIFDIYFNAEIPEEEVKREASVICEEIKMYHDNPRSHVFEKIKENLYQGAFGIFGAGVEENVRAMTRDQLFKKHRSIYVPKNSVLCVVGDNDFEEVLKLANEFVVERDGKEISFSEVIKQNLKSEENRDNLKQTNLAIGFHFPFEDKRSRLACEIFSTILGHGMSSKLFSEVREKRGLVYGVKAHLDSGKNYSYMFIWAGTDPSKKDEVIKICLKEFSKMKDLTEEELELAKIQVIGSREVSSENSNEQAVNLIFEEIRGSAEDYYSYENDIRKVSLEEVRNISNLVEHSLFVLGP